MKKIARISFFLFAFLITTSSKSQDYIPMAVEGAHWVVAYNHIDTPWLVDNLWEHYAEGDTTIEGETYIKVYTRDLVITQDPPPFEPIGDYELKGFLRDDSIQRKVYAIDLDSWNEFCPSNEEFVLFDFSLNQGDTAGFCLIPDFVTWTIDTIYPEIYIGFETTYFEFTNWGEIYFEGLGSTYGLFEPMFTPFKKVNQKYISYTYLYYYCRESPCDLLISLAENTFTETYFNIYPIPSKGNVNIQMRSSELQGKIKLFNVYGQLLITKQVQAGTTDYSLDLSAYPAGTYFLQYSEEGIVMDREKLIITK